MVDLVFGSGCLFLWVECFVGGEGLLFCDRVCADWKHCSVMGRLISFDVLAV